MNLAAFQEAFIEALLNKDVSEEALEKISHLPPSPILTQQFDVYRQNFLAGLSSILQDAYPTVAAILGTDFFTSTSNDYFIQHPPKNIDPILICENFATFIENTEFCEARPYLADIATIDLGCFQSKQAIDASCIDKNVFAELPPEQLSTRRMQLHPSCYWISSPYAIYDIWQQYNVGSGSRPFDQNSPQELIILRSGSNIRVYKATPGLVKTLDALDAGESLNNALQQGSKVQPGLDAMSTVQFLIQNDLVTSLY